MKDELYQNFNADEDKYADILSNIDFTKEKYENLKPFSDAEQDALQSYDEAFITKFTYDSNTIEGSTLSIGDTALVLDGENIPDKSVREILGAKGVAEGYDYARQQLELKRPFSEELIKDIHERTALDCDVRTRGSYRVNTVYLKGSMVVPVDPIRVRESMQDLMFHYNESKLHPVLKAITFHAMFENIHPFSDGNGRTGRTILNYMLEKDGYLPVSIKADDAKGYLQSLEEWQLNSNSLPFMNLVETSFLREYENRSEAVQKTREAVKHLSL